jgi:hypothetical protein
MAGHGMSITLDSSHMIVETIDPAVMVSTTGNPGMHDLAQVAKQRLDAALAALTDAPEPEGVSR